MTTHKFFGNMLSFTIGLCVGMFGCALYLHYENMIAGTAVSAIFLMIVRAAFGEETGE